MKWKLRSSYNQELTDETAQAVQPFPKEYYFINEFPFNSAFCYFFRGFKAKNSDNCFCPRKCSTSTCVMHNGKHMPEKFIIDLTDEIQISTIMKYLKKINVGKFQSKLKKMSFVWNFYIKLKITPSHIDYVEEL